MRKLASLVIGISLIVAPAAWAGPLAPGKPAGVRQAQMSGKDWVIVGGVAALGAGILIATAGGRSSNSTSLPSSVVTTNATSP